MHEFPYRPEMNDIPEASSEPATDQPSEHATVEGVPPSLGKPAAFREMAEADTIVVDEAIELDTAVETLAWAACILAKGAPWFKSLGTDESPGLKLFSVSGDCTSCHAGDIVYINDDAGNITFSHDAHLGMFGCEECHPDLFKPERGTNLATMEEMENGQSCGACHDGSTAFSVAGDCEACHEM